MAGFEPYPDGPDEPAYYHFWHIDKAQDFFIDTEEKYQFLMQWLEAACDYRPDLIPIVELEDRRA